MLKYSNFILIIIFLSNIYVLEARKIDLKNKKSTNEEVDNTFGSADFEEELKNFQNSPNSNDKSSKYEIS